MHSKLLTFVDKNRSLLLAFTLISLLFPIKYNSIFIVLLLIHWLLVVPLTDKKKYLKLNARRLGIFMVFVLLFAISLLYSSNLEIGLKDLESKLSLVILPLVILGQRPFNKEEMDKVLSLFSFSTLIACIIALGISIIGHQKVLVNQELSALIGIHASYLSLYAAISSFYFASKVLQRNATFTSGVVLTILVVSIFILSARMVILASFITIVLWFLLFQFNLKRVLILFVSVFILGIIGYNVPRINQRFSEAFNDEQVEFGNNENPNDPVKTYGGRAIRVAIWKCAIEVAQENWLLGVGAGDVHQHLQESYKRNEFELAWRFNNYNAHNLFIETIIAIGILGIITLLFLFQQLFSIAFNQKNLILFAFSTLFLLFSLIESSFNVQRGLVFFVFLSSLFFNLGLNKENA